MMVRPHNHAHNHAREPTAPPRSPPFEEDRLSSTLNSIGSQRYSNPSAIELFVRNQHERNVIAKIVDKDRAEGPTCQESHPDLLHWLREHSVIPDNVVTMFHPKGIAATKALAQKRVYASSKQRQVKHQSLKENVKNEGYWAASDRRPKHSVNSGQEQDPRSYGVQHRHSGDILIRKLIAKNYQLEYVGDYPGNGESFLPRPVSTTHLVTDVDVMSELRMIQEKISHEEALINNYASVFSKKYRPTVSLGYHRMQAQLEASELHRYLNTLLIGSLTNPIRWEQELVTWETKALYRIKNNRPNGLRIDPAPSRKVSRAEMKKHTLETACFMDNRQKVFERTGYSMPSPTVTLCVAAKYQLWLHEHDDHNNELYAERAGMPFSESYVPQVTRVEKDDNTSQFDKNPHWKKNEDGTHTTVNRRTSTVESYVLESKRNTVLNLIPLLLEAGPPGKSVPGTLTSLVAMNDPINPDATEQEVHGPHIPDEVSEMRSKVQRRKSNLSVFKKGGMSRPRARIASIEEAKHKISTYESSGAPPIVIYMPSSEDKEADAKSDKFVKEFMNKR